MDNLRNLQLAIAQALFLDVPTSSLIHDSKHLAIYRNNIFINFTEALKTIYPMIIKLVSEDFFNFLADAYIRIYPSRSGDLNDFGEDFHKFLSTFSATKSLIYLPDVARLEWYCQQVNRAGDHTFLDMTRLQSIPTEKYPQLKFRLHPASQLFASDFPILKIWELCQKEKADAELSIDLSSGSVKLLVTRCYDNITFIPLSAGEFALLNAFLQEKNFSDACIEALMVDGKFNITDCLQRFMGEGIIVDFF